MDLMIINLGSAYVGESTTTGYAQMIEVSSFQHSISQPLTGDLSNQKRTTGVATHGSFVFTKYLDLASASILQSCNQSTLLPTVTFYILQSQANANVAYWSVMMTNVLIADVSISSGGGKPIESVSLQYTAITWTYKQQTDADATTGSATSSWNLSTNATT
jgi:type VI secretion system secreted protein Hcp